ncbi:MAG: hypothetical protein AAGI91_17635 [Bacteroidota bacterium]
MSLSARRGTRRVLFENIPVESLQKLFRDPLAVPIRFENADQIQIDVNSGQGVVADRANVAIVGYTAEQLDALESSGRLDPSAEAVLLHSSLQVPAGAVETPLRFESRGIELGVRRVLVSVGGGRDDELTLAFRTGTADLLPAMTATQYGELFSEHRIEPSLVVPDNRPLTAYVTNPTGDNVDVSIIMEAYRTA